MLFRELFEVDMCLRSSENSGLLVSSLASLSTLKTTGSLDVGVGRARPMVGDAYLSQQFQSSCFNVLSEARALPSLKNEVLKMREKCISV
jgi:glutamine synthetase adenylyltransferase